MQQTEQQVNENPTTQVLADVKEVGRIVGFSRSKVHVMLEAGEFPKPLKLGRSVRWRIADVHRWIDQQAAAQGVA